MSKTVVGIFEYESDAQNAQNYLLANGFGDGDVDIKTASYKTEGEEPHLHEDADLFERIGNFFQELFNDDHHETERYIDAGKRGTIVTVHAASSEEAIAAAHIMDEYGALDVTNKLATEPAYTEPGQQYEDPIVNPPSVGTGHGPLANQVEARGVYLKSRIIDRPVNPDYRLRQNQIPTGSPAPDPLEGDAPELHKTIAERDALINEIVDNEELKSR